MKTISLNSNFERKINNISSEWKTFSNVQKKWKTLKLRFDSESNEKLIQLKNEICPSLEIDNFNGTYDFGKKLPIKVQKRNDLTIYQLSERGTVGRGTFDDLNEWLFFFV